MALIDDLLAAQKGQGRACYTCELYDTLDDDTVEELNQAYRHPGVNYSTVWRHVRDTYKVKFSDAAFHNHYRRGHDAR